MNDPAPVRAEQFRNVNYVILASALVAMNPITLALVIAGFMFFRSVYLVAYAAALALALWALVRRLARASVIVSADGRQLTIRSLWTTRTASTADIELVEYRWSFPLDVVVPYTYISGTYGIVRRKADGRAMFTRIPVTVCSSHDEKFARRVEDFFGSLGIPVCSIDPRRRKRLARQASSSPEDPPGTSIGAPR